MADSVAGEFKDIPMAALISGPLIASCDAQVKLANAAFDFYQKVAYEDGDSSKPRLLNFKLERPVETPEGGFERQDLSVNAPFLGLVPVPSLLIDDVNVEFQMEVTSAKTEKEKSSKEAGTDASVKAGFGPWGVRATIHGKLTSSRENTRSTNQTAKYQVTVNASQQQQTEGLSRLMDIMASCIVPISPTAGGGGGAKKK